MKCWSKVSENELLFFFVKVTLFLSSTWGYLTFGSKFLESLLSLLDDRMFRLCFRERVFIESDTILNIYNSFHDSKNFGGKSQMSNLKP